MKVSMHFEGGDKLAAGLSQLSQRVSKGVQRKALMAGGEPIRAQGEKNAPHDPSTPKDIRDNIVIATARSSEDTAVAVGPRKGFAYGLPNEIGTARQPARPFMRPAFDTHKEKALSGVNLVLRRELIRRDVLDSARTTPQGSSESIVGPEDPGITGGPGGGLL